MSLTEKFSDFGYEINLDLDPDNQKIYGLFALAQTIQNLLLTEPGTYPNQPELGVGISNEQMELLDSITLNNLKERIEKQLEKFIPTDKNIEVFVTTQNLNQLSNQKMLMCGFAIQDEITSNEVEPTLFSIVFAQDKKKNLFSKIII